jgi:hypothetical protein
MPNDGRYPSAKPLTAMKTFKFEVDNTEYQAENYVNGIFINPVLPDNFWAEPLENRTSEHMRHWENMPFILSDDGFYQIHCLDGGAWDRPSLMGGFDSLDKAVEFIVETYRK